MEVRVSGIDRLERMIETISISLSPEALAIRAVEMAQEAGVILKQGAVQACMEAVYQNARTPRVLQNRDGSPAFVHGDNPEDRTEDLINAHTLYDEGLLQRVEIDPTLPVSSDAHSGRELVIDYAIPVHEGYTQWIPTREGARNTGVFHPGRFWFDVAAVEMFPFIVAAIESAFTAVIEEAVDRMVA